MNNYNLTPKEMGEVVLVLMRDSPDEFPDTSAVAKKMGVSEAAVLGYISAAGGTDLFEEKTYTVKVKKSTYKLKGDKK
jgi:hypothetical protein